MGNLLGNVLLGKILLLDTGCRAVKNINVFNYYFIYYIL